LGKQFPLRGILENKITRCGTDNRPAAIDSSLKSLDLLDGVAHRHQSQRHLPEIGDLVDRQLIAQRLCITTK